MGRDRSRQSETWLEKKQDLLPSSPEAGQGQGRNDKTLDSFTYLKIFLDFRILSKGICGKCQEFFQVWRPEPCFLRGQSIHVSGERLESVLPMAGLKSSPQFSKRAFRDIPGQSPPCPLLAPGGSLNCSEGHRPRGECTPQASLMSPTSRASCELHEGPGWIFLHLGRKNFPKQALKRQRVGQGKYLQQEALTELRAPRNQEDSHRGPSMEMGAVCEL